MLLIGYYYIYKIIIEGFHKPTRQTLCSIRGHVYSECIKLTLSLILTSVGRIFNIPKNQKLWTSKVIKDTFTKIIRMINIIGVHKQDAIELLFKLKDRRGAMAILSQLTRYIYYIYNEIFR